MMVPCHLGREIIHILGVIAKQDMPCHRMLKQNISLISGQGIPFHKNINRHADLPQIMRRAGRGIEYQPLIVR